MGMVLFSFSTNIHAENFSFAFLECGSTRSFTDIFFSFSRCAYFWSAADGCSDGADKAAHGNTPYLAWLLQQVRQYQLSSGIRVLDYLDNHYYPQGGEYSSDETNGLDAMRLRSVKSLYDPTYVGKKETETSIGNSQGLRLLFQMNLGSMQW